MKKKEKLVETENQGSANIDPVVQAKANVNTVLDQMKDKFPLILVIGVDENSNIDMMSNINQYPHMHWMLSRAQFTLNVHENNAQNQKQEN